MLSATMALVVQRAGRPASFAPALRWPGAGSIDKHRVLEPVRLSSDRRTDD